MAGAVQKARWALLDAVEMLARIVWPAPLRGALGWAFLAPALILVGILVIGLGQMLETSLHELNLATYRLGDAYTLANYATALERPVTWRVLARTLGGAGIVTLVTLLLAFPYAYLLVRTGSAWARKFLLVALFLPFFIGQVVRAYGWLIILGREGLLNSALKAVGLPAQDFLFAYPTVLFGLVQYMLPFAVLLIIPALSAIGEEVELASESLGARWPSTFRHVVLPMAAPGLIGASVVVFTLTLTDFAMPEILGGGTQDFFASAIYDSFFQISNAGLGAALSILLTLIGSVIVAAVFMMAGTGTLGFRGGRR
ncbi:ABC transporter permease [Acuticoccus sediminis]|uniref:ABC transporter permease n=1 Tax=Acuticoccus sediminis TaxID=2184697 RepID=A0A8B2NZA8_9HYPH|nr:ABC transporter permease [Acuticoccus sediminis]RAI03216.1 ABC transporter permease [Acuticoccus sediminis]